MAVNPLELLKMRERLQIFREQHPRFEGFIQELTHRAVQEGTVAELKVTLPNGEELITNIRLTPEDVETFQLAREIGRK